MTTATMALTEPAEKGADIDLLRQRVQSMARRLLDIDAEGAAAPATARRVPIGPADATATGVEPGRRGRPSRG